MQSGQNYPVLRARRADGITLIAVYHWLVAAMFLAGSVALALPTLILGVVAVTAAAPAAIGMLAVGLGATIMMAFSILFLAVGYGLWTLRQWGRIAAMALAVPTLLMIPIGTILGALILWRLAKPQAAQEFEFPV